VVARRIEFVGGAGFPGFTIGDFWGEDMRGWLSAEPRSRKGAFTATAAIAQLFNESTIEFDSNHDRIHTNFRLIRFQALLAFCFAYIQIAE
jgi:hypothetical protein